VLLLARFFVVLVIKTFLGTFIVSRYSRVSDTDRGRRALSVLDFFLVRFLSLCASLSISEGPAVEERK